MAAVRNPELPLSREREYAGDQPISSLQHASMRASSLENLSSPTTSRVFEGMLKTTTETGDIGFFSIKSSRISQPISGPRKVYQPRQPLLRQAQIRDARRNFLYNAQDASSEILSIYDAASQKSLSQNSDLNHPHYRSYSAAHSSSTLSNRRSHATLPRQMGDNGPLQRPRSPFPYSSRGVNQHPRPWLSSVVDGGGTGYPPRPESERLLYERGHGTLSAPPLHFRKQRSPTLSLHHHANWSTPSLLDQTLAPHRNSNPNLRHSSGPPVHGWGHRNDPAVVSISPARSNFSLSSAGDLQQDTRLPSVRTTPTKAHPPYPLYYDYAEDFGPNGDAHPEIPVPPSQIHSAKIIPETLQVSTDCLESENCNNSATGNGSDHVFPTPCSPQINLETSVEASQFRQMRKASISGPKHEVLQMLTTANLQNKSGNRPVDNSRNTQCIGTSKLDFEVQASQTRPEEQPVLVQLPATDNIDRHGSTGKRRSQRDISYDYHRSTPTAEDRDIGPMSVDVRRSVTFDHKSFAYDGSGISSPQHSSTFLDESKASGEDLGSLGVSILPLVSHDSDQHRQKGNVPSIWTRLDTITLPDSNQQDVLHSADLALIADSEDPMVTAKSFLNMGQTKLKDEASQVMEMLPLLQPGSARCSSHLIPQDRPAQNEQFGRASQRNPCTPIQLDSTSARNLLQSRKEGEWLQTSISSTELNLMSQAQTPLHFSSLDCSSFYSFEESHPLYSQNLDAESLDSLQHGDDNDADLPKFRLKITRPSDSIPGTVRVNRASADSKPLVVLEQRDTRDLFTPSSGIENIFQQVSKHLHAPRASPSSIHSQIERGKTHILAPIPNQLSDNKQSSAELNVPHLAATANPLNPSDVQSFFSDDSSHIYGKRNLRKRLSNLRARVVIPYGTKNGAHSYDGACSYDNINGRDGNGGQHSTLPAARSAGNLNAVDIHGEASRRRQLKDRMHAQKLRGKVTRWIREVKSAIMARMKPRGLHYSRSEEGDAGVSTNV